MRRAATRRGARPAREGERGFTLIELMISLVLFSFAIAGVLSVAVSMSQGFREQRAAVGAEGSVRVPLDFIGDALRQASPGSPTGNIEDAALCTAGAMTVTNNQTALSDPTITGWDKLDVIYASGAVVTSTRGIYALGSTSLDLTDASQLAAGDSIVISDLNQGVLVKVNSISGNTVVLAAQCGTISTWFPAGGFAAGSLVVRAQHSTFTLDAVDGIPTLMMDPDAGGPAAAEPLAEGVEDMQIALGVDVNADGVVTEAGTIAGDDEWQGNVAGDAVLSGTLRAVRVTLIARTTSGQIGNIAPYFRPAAEDHTAGTTFDTYRRRVLRTMVEIRNMSGSP